MDGSRRCSLLNLVRRTAEWHCMERKSLGRSRNCVERVTLYRNVSGRVHMDGSWQADGDCLRCCVERNLLACGRRRNTQLCDVPRWNYMDRPRNNDLGHEGDLCGLDRIALGCGWTRNVPYNRNVSGWRDLDRAGHDDQSVRVGNRMERLSSRGCRWRWNGYESLRNLVGWHVLDGTGESGAHGRGNWRGLEWLRMDGGWNWRIQLVCHVDRRDDLGWEGSGRAQQCGVGNRLDGSPLGGNRNWIVGYHCNI